MNATTRRTASPKSPQQAEAEHFDSESLLVGLFELIILFALAFVAACAWGAALS